MMIAQGNKQEVTKVVSLYKMVKKNIEVYQYPYIKWHFCQSISNYRGLVCFVCFFFLVNNFNENTSDKQALFNYIYKIT